MMELAVRMTGREEVMEINASTKAFRTLTTGWIEACRIEAQDEIVSHLADSEGECLFGQ